MVAVEKEGGFTVSSHESFNEKAKNAISAIFIERKEISLTTVKAKAIGFFKRMNLEGVLKGIKKSMNHCLEEFLVQRLAKKSDNKDYYPNFLKRHLAERCRLEFA